MIKQNQRILNILNLISDVALTFLAYYVSVVIRFRLMDGVWTIDLLSRDFFQVIGAYCVVQLLLLYMLGVYVPQRYRRIRYELFAIVYVNALCMLLMVAWFYIWRIHDVSRTMMVFFYCLSSLMICSKHLVVRIVMRGVRSMGFNQRHVILVGDGYLARQYVANVRKNAQMGFCINGYIGRKQAGDLGAWMGDISQVHQILQEHADIDELIIALSSDQEEYLPAIVDAANRFGIRAKVIPQYNDYIPSNPRIDVIGKIKLIDLNASPLDNLLNAAIKRLADVFLSFFGIILISPLLLAIAIGVKLSSPGPVFFVQERVGRNKKPFPMLKFRSMRVNDDSGTAWTTDTDPRKTVFGSFIRKTSLDELPQLFNVLVGQMSLVGPRPEIPYHVEHLQEEVPSYLVRQQVRPGMTGWAQIHGYRGNTDIKKRIELDLWYIHNWCIRLDIEILWRTLTGGFLNQETISVGK